MYKTQFSFKNLVDNFYIQYLENNNAKMEVFINRAQNAIKIGTAQINLNAILEKNSTAQVAEIIFEAAPGSDIGHGLSIGTIHYKMRMRKPIDNALTAYTAKKNLMLSKDPIAFARLKSSKDFNPGTINSKMISIVVKEAKNLVRPDDANNKKEMMPFYHYTFYTSEYTSPISRGSNPRFDIRQQYELPVDE